jgi:hypothetical protein
MGGLLSPIGHVLLGQRQRRDQLSVVHGAEVQEVGDPVEANAAK